jgi:AraC-like DNA-binding protein
MRQGQPGAGYEEPIVRGYAVTHPPGTWVLPLPAPEPGRPGWDRLVYAASGVMTVLTGAGTWVVPPHRAVWVPAGPDNRIELTGQAALRTLYIEEGWPGVPTACGAVNVPPLLRELILHVGRIAPLYRSDPAHRRLAGVLVDQLATLPLAPLQLPRPSDGRARALADRLLAEPADGRPVDELARSCGASRRTLERLFAAETGMTIGQWRTRARLVAAIRGLAAGESATAVAAASGYSTPSAFGAAFRRELGTSPRRYLATTNATPP